MTGDVYEAAKEQTNKQQPANKLREQLFKSRKCRELAALFRDLLLNAFEPPRFAACFFFLLRLLFLLLLFSYVGMDMRIFSRHLCIYDTSLLLSFGETFFFSSLFWDAVWVLCFEWVDLP